MLARIRTALYRSRRRFTRKWLRSVWGMDIGHGVTISRKADLDYTNPRGVHIGDFTIVTPRAQIFSHDFVNARHVDTYIGSNCFIGAGAIILPGVVIGDNCIIAAGSVVTTDVPPRTLVAGNPAQVVRTELTTYRYGMLVNPDGS